jgi:hypothetical protein
MFLSLWDYWFSTLLDTICSHGNIDNLFLTKLFFLFLPREEGGGEVNVGYWGPTRGGGSDFAPQSVVCMSRVHIWGDFIINHYVASCDHFESFDTQSHSYINIYVWGPTLRAQIKNYYYKFFYKLLTLSLFDTCSYTPVLWQWNLGTPNNI